MSLWQRITARMNPPPLTDSHCHLDFPQFEGETDALVARAAEAGVHRMVTICTRLGSEPAVRAIAEAHAPVFYGIIGFVMGALFAVVYNLVAGWVGGLELGVAGLEARALGAAGGVAADGLVGGRGRRRDGVAAVPEGRRRGGRRDRAAVAQQRRYRAEDLQLDRASRPGDRPRGIQN